MEHNMDIVSYEQWTNITPKYETLGENVLWAYANLQMLGASIASEENVFTRQSYMVRSKAFKAYIEGRWQIRDMYELNKAKIKNNDTCWYCRSLVQHNQITADHVFPRVLGGSNDMENIIFVCKTCNSSKGKKDLMEWLVSYDYVPEYLVLEQYLKEAYFYIFQNSLQSIRWDDITSLDLPFNANSILLFQNSTFLKIILNRIKKNV